MRLRLLDLGLTVLALAVLALPLALAGLIGRPVRLPRLGRGGRPFILRRLELPEHLPGRVLDALGAGRWPELFNVWVGDLSWVGPAPRAAAAPMDLPPAVVRPGLFSTWYLRRRTAIDFDGEPAADADDLARRSVRHHLGVVARGLLVALMRAPAGEPPARLHIADVTIDNLDVAEALSRIDRLMDVGRGALVCFANPACINVAARHRGYRRALGRAALVLPDGIGLKIAGDLLGTPLRQNVNGTDLFPRLMDLLDARGARVFLLGGRRGIPERVAGEIARHWPRVHIAGMRDGYFAPAQEGAVVEAIHASGADVLLVARGVPAQEQFVDRHATSLGVKVAIGVGGLFDFVSGRIPRAPQWMREMGAEWVYRLLQEPARMWRRYLVGNLSFLTRVLLQRWGLRRPADDELGHPDPRAAGSDREAVRGVIFATAAAGAEIPVPRNEPAALLPAGCGTLVERQIAQMAACGIRQIDLVICDAPERLRALLGQGARWGVNLTWHLVKDPARPYAVLRSTALRQAERLVIGHADSWIGDDAVQQLAGQGGVAMHTDGLGRRHWTGWAGGPADLFSGVLPQSDRSDLRWRLMRAPLRQLELDAQCCVTRLDAAGLLRLQALVTGPDGARGLPRSWIATPWGGYSPEAHVHPDARIEGPVLIGSGCIVERGAQLGPNTWLSRDVIVSSGSHLTEALILPGTYIGAGLDVHQAIVNGRRVRSLRHQVEAVVPADQGVLDSVHRQRPIGRSRLGRLMAALALAATLPLAGPAVLAARLRRGAWPWATQRTVVGRCADSGALEFGRLSVCREPASRAARLAAGWAALVDVVRGRRSWFGVRPRTPSQWYALSAEWQQMLAQMPVGLVHEPAWFAEESQRFDAEAAADVFYATRAGWRENLRLCAAALRALGARTPLPWRPAAAPAA